MAPNFGDAPSKNLLEVFACVCTCQLNSLSASMCYSCNCHFCTSVVHNMDTITKYLGWWNPMVSRKMHITLEITSMRQICPTVPGVPQAPLEGPTTPS